jgi:hypothetical protein
LGEELDWVAAGGMLVPAWLAGVEVGVGKGDVVVDWWISFRRRWW